MNVTVNDRLRIVVNEKLKKIELGKSRKKIQKMFIGSQPLKGSHLRKSIVSLINILGDRKKS